VNVGDAKSIVTVLVWNMHSRTDPPLNGLNSIGNEVNSAFEASSAPSTTRPSSVRPSPCIWTPEPMLSVALPATTLVSTSAYVDRSPVPFSSASVVAVPDVPISL